MHSGHAKRGETAHRSARGAKVHIGDVRIVCVDTIHVEVVVEHSAQDFAAVTRVHRSGDFVVRRPAELTVAEAVHIGVSASLPDQPLVV
jgi:hypothetical protein